MPPNPSSRNWCFTLNNWTEADILALAAFSDLPAVVFMAFQKEIAPTTQTPHLQGLVVFQNARILAGLTRRQLPFTRCRMSMMTRSIQTNLAYCTKDESRVPETTPYLFGTPPGQGRRTDMETMHLFLRDTHPMPTVPQMWEENFQLMLMYRRGLLAYRSNLVPVRRTPTIVTTYWSSTTGNGKTTRAFHEAGPGAYTVHPGVKSKTSQQRLWVDNYGGEENVVIDDYDGFIAWPIFLQVIDCHPLTLETKGGTTNWCPKRIWITSNSNPFTDWYTREDGIAPLVRRLTTRGSQVIEMLHSQQEPWTPPIPEDPLPYEDPAFIR